MKKLQVSRKKFTIHNKTSISSFLLIPYLTMVLLMCFVKKLSGVTLQQVPLCKDNVRTD